MSTQSNQQVSQSGTGGPFFAALLMIIGGVMAALTGIAGIAKTTFYVVPANYWITLNVTSWGWVLVGMGVILLVAGFGVMSGANWARWLGIGVVSVSAVVSFLFIPIAPFVSITLIVVDLGIIYSLVLHAREPQMIYLNPAAAPTSQTQAQTQSQAQQHMQTR